MHFCFLARTRGLAAILFAAMLYLAGETATCDEPRAPAPEFSAADTRSVFFDDLSEAIVGERPPLNSLQTTKLRQPSTVSRESREDTGATEGGSGWPEWVSATSLEDEVKRVRLQFERSVTTPGAFASGGFQDARRELSILAMLFAVIHEFEGEVRWKEEAAAARDLMARTALNSKAGSTQVYNEAKLRQQDLQDLVSGSGLSGREGGGENDWAMIVDRSPMMQYAEQLLDRLEQNSRDESTVKENLAVLRRDAEMLAILGIVLQSEGMDDAGDEDYDELSQNMAQSASLVAAAINRGDTAAVRRGVGSVSQTCSECHDSYR